MRPVRVQFVQLRPVLAFVVAFALIAGVSACADGTPSGPNENPLSGLVQAERGDTASVPPSGTPGAPGHFTGTVYGYTITSGGDTLSSAVKLPGVRVTVYVRTFTNDNVTAGGEVASVTTNSEGVFVTPALPGGDYVVTFVPPVGSEYRGGWTVAHAWAESGSHPWWIMLPRI